MSPGRGKGSSFTVGGGDKSTDGQGRGKKQVLGEEIKTVVEAGVWSLVLVRKRTSRLKEKRIVKREWCLGDLMAAGFQKNLSGKAFVLVEKGNSKTLRKRKPASRRSQKKRLSRAFWIEPSRFYSR